MTAYAVIPGREDVALFLEEAMKGEGWQGSKMNVKRRCLDKKLKANERRESERQAIAQILDLDSNDPWWRGRGTYQSSLEDSEDEDDGEDEGSFLVRL